eukprot:SAG31_NODE_21257_length_554_cov_0.676923_1_plen_67_part_00
MSYRQHGPLQGKQWYGRTALPWADRVTSSATFGLRSADPVRTIGGAPSPSSHEVKAYSVHMEVAER